MPDQIEVEVQLSEAQTARRSSLDERIEEAVELILAETGKPGTNFTQVSPHARHKLSGLLKYYAKKPHPFRACVRDNRKRFGPRTEGICAVLKDMIRGTTRWRGHPERDHGAPGALAASEDAGAVVIDDDLATLLLDMSDKTASEVESLIWGTDE